MGGGGGELRRAARGRATSISCGSTMKTLGAPRSGDVRPRAPVGDRERDARHARRTARAWGVPAAAGERRAGGHEPRVQRPGARAPAHIRMGGCGGAGVSGSRDRRADRHAAARLRHCGVRPCRARTSGHEAGAIRRKAARREPISRSNPCPADSPSFPCWSSSFLPRALAAQSAADSAAIRATALDYIDGWYTGDATRMERALHPELAKRIVQTDAQGHSRLGQQSAMTLVQNTRAAAGTIRRRTNGRARCGSSTCTERGQRAGAGGDVGRLPAHREEQRAMGHRQRALGARSTCGGRIAVTADRHRWTAGSQCRPARAL